MTEIWFPIEKDEHGFPRSRDWEGLHCEVIDVANQIYRVNNVPFYLKNIALNDLIKARASDKGYLAFDQVLQRSGCSVYRLLLKTDNAFTSASVWLESMSIQFEREGDLIALSVAADQDADRVVDFILEGKEVGLWGAQDGFVYEQA